MRPHEPLAHSYHKRQHHLSETAPDASQGRALTSGVPPRNPPRYTGPSKRHVRTPHTHFAPHEYPLVVQAHVFPR